jgi:predicted peptidase
MNFNCVLVKQILVLLIMSCSYIVSASVNHIENHIDNEMISISVIEKLLKHNNKDSLAFSDISAQYNDAKAQLINFQSDGLNQYGLQLTPTITTPKLGWPVVIFLHGYHPNPINYGRLKNGETLRPGAYYQNFPLSYVDNGLMVIAPDYRGHNDSEGQIYIKQSSASLYYLRDVINLFRQIQHIENIDKQRIYIVGHSMGASMAMMVSHLLEDSIAASSIWSLAAPAQALANKSQSWQTVLAKLRKNRALSIPIQFHHGIDDTVTPLLNTTAATRWLTKTESSFRLYTYPTNKHLIDGEDYQQAIKRDILWFKQHSKTD